MTIPLKYIEYARQPWIAIPRKQMYQHVHHYVLQDRLWPCCNTILSYFEHLGSIHLPYAFSFLQAASQMTIELRSFTAYIINKNFALIIFNYFLIFFYIDDAELDSEFLDVILSVTINIYFPHKHYPLEQVIS